MRAILSDNLTSGERVTSSAYQSRLRFPFGVIDLCFGQVTRAPGRRAAKSPQHRPRTNRERDRSVAEGVVARFRVGTIDWTDRSQGGGCSQALVLLAQPGTLLRRSSMDGRLG